MSDEWKTWRDAAMTDLGAAIVAPTEKMCLEHMRDALAHLRRAVQDLEDEIGDV